MEEDSPAGGSRVDHHTVVEEDTVDTAVVHVAAAA